MRDDELIEIIADGIVDGTDLGCTTVDQARAVLKALRDAEVLPQWRPIETAPKDESRFLASGINFGDDKRGRHVVIAEWFIENGVFIDSGDYETLLFLTHWQPLPEAPQ